MVNDEDIRQFCFEENRCRGALGMVGRGIEARATIPVAFCRYQDELIDIGDWADGYAAWKQFASFVRQYPVFFAGAFRGDDLSDQLAVCVERV